MTTSSKIDPQKKHAASRKAQSAQQDARLRAAKRASTKAPPSDGVSPGHGGGKEEGHNGSSGPILHRMLCIMQGMEVDIVSLKADVASLKNSNDQQAKELVRSTFGLLHENDSEARYYCRGCERSTLHTYVLKQRTLSARLFGALFLVYSCFRVGRKRRRTG